MCNMSPGPDTHHQIHIDAAGGQGAFHGLLSAAQRISIAEASQLDVEMSTPGKQSGDRLNDPPSSR